MKVTIERKGILNFSMEYGSYLGLYFIVKFLLATLSLRFAICDVLSALMLVGIPFVLYYLMIRFRRQNGGASFYSLLWMLGILLFFFASMISGLAEYIYYAYIDPQYIHNQVTALLSLLESMPSLQENEMMNLARQGFENGAIPSPIEMVIQTMWANVFFGSLLSMIVAWPANRKRIASQNDTDNTS